MFGLLIRRNRSKASWALATTARVAPGACAGRRRRSASLLGPAARVCPEPPSTPIRTRKPLSAGRSARPPTNAAQCSPRPTTHVKRPGVSAPSTARTHSRQPTSRSRIGELLGRIRDREAEWTQRAYPLTPTTARPPAVRRSSRTTSARRSSTPMGGRIAISTSWTVPTQQQCVRCPPVQALLPTKRGHPHWDAPWCGCVVTGAGR